MNNAPSPNDQSAWTPVGDAVLAMRMVEESFHGRVLVTNAVDLGDAWRVYWAKRDSPGSVAWPQRVPRLVDKTTGRVTYDWPYHAGGGTARESFDLMLKELRPGLLGLGYTGSGRGYRLPHLTEHRTLAVIRYRSSTRVLTELYVLMASVAKDAWDQRRAALPDLRLPALPQPGQAEDWSGVRSRRLQCEPDDDGPKIAYVTYAGVTGDGLPARLLAKVSAFDWPAGSGG